MKFLVGPWSLAEERTLASLFLDGLDDQAIGARLNRSEWAVKQRRQRLQIFRKRRDVEKGKSTEICPSVKMVFSEWIDDPGGVRIRTVMGRAAA